MVERILSLINQSDLKDYALEKQIGFAQGTIGNWRNGRNKLSSEAVIKLARYFNVSSDYLLGLNDDPTPIKQSHSSEYSINLFLEVISLSKDKRFAELIKLYKAMSKECREKIYIYVLGVAAGSGLNDKILEK